MRMLARYYDWYPPEMAYSNIQIHYGRKLHSRVVHKVIRERFMLDTARTILECVERSRRNAEKRRKYHERVWNTVTY